MTDGREPLVVLFADLADSTSLYKTYGDERARDIVLECLGILGDIVESCEGTVVERIGDELMCTFADAHSAAVGAIEMQKKVDLARQEERLSRDVGVRIGLHFGPVILDKGGIFGDTVYTAKRVSTLAKRQQILTTAETVGELGSSWEALCPFVNKTTIKGKKEIFEIHEIIWDESVHTLDVVTPLETSNRDSEVHLTHCDSETILSESRPLYTIGRSEHCDFTVEDKEVSRLHARIEFRKGKSHRRKV